MTPRQNGATVATAHATGDPHLQDLRLAMKRSQFVRRCAQSLLLDTAVTATAITLCQQFYAQRSAVTCIDVFRVSCHSEEQFDHHIISGACIFLATKSCELPRTLRSVVNVVHSIVNTTTEPLGADAAYANLKNSLINAEQTVLRVLRFEIDVVLPHSFLFNYARHLNVSASTTQCALALVNDVVGTPDALHFPPPALAASCLYLATQIMQDEPIEAATKWWYHYDTTDDDLRGIARLVERIRDAVAAP